MLDPLAIVVPDDWYPVGNTSERLGTAPRKLSSSEIQHIKDELAGRFRTLFTNELADGGYLVAERPGEDAVRVNPGLADLQMNTPERSLAASRDADRMMLVMGVLQFPNTVANSADFRHAVQSWAQRLRTGLDQMSAQSP